MESLSELRLRLKAVEANGDLIEARRVEARIAAVERDAPPVSVEVERDEAHGERDGQDVEKRPARSGARRVKD